MKIFLLCVSWMAAGGGALEARAGAEPAQAGGGTLVGASRGGVTFSSEGNSLTIGARLQTRWTTDWRDEFDADTVGSGVGRLDDAISQLDVPRLRLSLSGRTRSSRSVPEARRPA